ncbi:hypothetical protein Barb4_01192 [Bacteroidales bacterium Barb4]|nr:hypothetical protein Barb4_01192 [Bacteroidales bacterium Barb4]
MDLKCLAHKGQLSLSQELNFNRSSESVGVGETASAVFFTIPLGIVSFVLSLSLTLSLILFMFGLSFI